jgi:hypothetical protein
MSDAIHTAEVIVVRRDAPVRCPCGRTIARGARRQRFCSTKCRKRDCGKKRCRKAGLASDTGGATHPPKKFNGINGVPGPKSGPTPPIFGPVHVIAAEVFGGQWDRVVSDDGVGCWQQQPTALLGRVA